MLAEKKNDKRAFILLCQLSPLLWDVLGLVIPCGSIRGFFFLSNEHLNFLILFSEMTSYLRSSEIKRFEMLLLLKAYFACRQSV